MKLRQKLAVVLASAMAISAVPVVTMASSSNKIVRYASAIKKDSKTTTAGYLGIKFEDNDSQYEEEFYFELTNAEWLKWDEKEDQDIIANSNTGYGSGDGAVRSFVRGVEEDTFVVTFGDGQTATYKRQSDKVVKVNFTPSNNKTQYVFPFALKATGGVISVATKVEGSGSSITENSYSFASTGEKAATLTMGDLKSFYDEGELTPINLKESFAGSLLNDDTLILKIQLDDTDWEFRASSDVEVKGTYGFDFTAKESKNGTADNKGITVKLEIDGDDDDNTAYVIIKGLKTVYGTNTTNANGTTASRSQGRLEIKGLKVMADEDEDLSTGELKADIKAVKSVTVNSNKYSSELELDKDYNDTVVAKIAKYGASIVMKDEKVVDIKAGRTKEVVFKVQENIDDCFVEGRKITIRLDSEEYKDSYFMIEYKGKDADYSNLIDDKVDGKDIIKSVEIDWHDDKVWEKTGKGVDEKAVSTKVTTENDAKCVGKKRKADAIIVTLKDDNNDEKHALNKNNRIDWFKVKTDVYVPLGQYAKESLNLVGSMRGIDADAFQGTKAVNVIKPYTVETEQTTLKVGLQDQKATKVVVTETDKEMFEKGSLFFDINNGSKEDDGFVVDNKGKLTATGNLKTTDFDNTSDADKFYLKRDSDAASSITIEDWEITVDRTVPEGYYDLEIKGTAVDDYDGKWKVADYIKIGTANTQDITNANGLAAATAVFTIGANTYTVNSIEQSMDAPAYIQDPGYTMIPMRYVAKAFGVSEKNILFSNGTATIFAGARTIQLTSNSDIAIVNGAQVKLATKVVNKDGRIYVPVGEVANILGVNKTWDATTKTATFSNVNTTETK